MDTSFFNNTQILNQPTNWVTSNCADIMFINITPQTVVAPNGVITVNGFPLVPGGWVSFGAETGQVNTTQFEVIISPTATQCFVLKKTYNPS